MRLDETNEHTVDILTRVHHIDVRAIINNNASIDVCRECYLKLQDEHGIEDDVDHPDYNEYHYVCHICGCKLNQWRDG